MSRVRLWLFTERFGDYPEGGTYDTSVIDTDSGNCSDPQQFIKFQDLLESSIDYGEELQQVGSAEEAYALCSRARIVGPTTCGGGYSPNESTFGGAISRPTPSSCGIPTGGGMRNTPMQNCPPAPAQNEPTNFNQPIVQTQTDRARRIIALFREGKNVPTVVQ